MVDGSEGGKKGNVQYAGFFWGWGYKPSFYEALIYSFIPACGYVR